MRRRTVGRFAFPTSPDPAWSAATLARWREAVRIARTMTGRTDRYGWFVERQLAPGAPSMLAIWAVTLLAVMPLAHVLTAWAGSTPGLYLTALIAVGGVAAGAVARLRADRDAYSPIEEEHVLLAAELRGDEEEVAA